MALSNQSLIPTTRETAQLSQGLAQDPYVRSYYRHFHRSHPFLLPFGALSQGIATHIPPYLIAMIRAFGAHYIEDRARAALFRDAVTVTYANSSTNNEDPFRVQYLLLKVIMEHAYHEEESAYETMQEAMTLAVEMGFDDPGFGPKHAYGNSSMEESWRRTYWELFVISCLFAAMRNKKSRTLCNRVCVLPLPCGEVDYHAGRVRNCPITCYSLIDADISFIG